MVKTDRQSMLDRIVVIAESAGKAIMDIYNNAESKTVCYKEDKSPLTRADMASHNIILEELKKLNPSIPVLSEESNSIAYEVRQNWSQFWLVDPMDGTKEFIKRNGDFTVNIALIDSSRAVLGVVHAPAIGVTYSALLGKGAFKFIGSEKQKIAVAGQYSGQIKVIASRSHGNAAVKKFIEKLQNTECMVRGSSLKFCLVAEGTAHIYPRFGPTMEWDTAAAQCIVEAAGGTVTDTNGVPLRYNKIDLHNPFFIVNGLKNFPWRLYLEDIPI